MDARGEYGDSKACKEDTTVIKKIWRCFGNEG